MAKVTKDVAERRPEEILNACRDLYATMSFQEISAKTSISRPSIYTYFESKEEIFLAILKEEYDCWTEDLLHILQCHNQMTTDEFARTVGHTLAARTTLLKIQCMNLYEIEEHCRLERLTDFKRSYRRALEAIDRCLVAYFCQITEPERLQFCYSFFPFMYGMYPYAFPTERQKEAMRQAGISVRKVTVAQLAYECIRKLLGEQTPCP
ncbi:MULTISPECIES: TetR family transcriptional regulator [Negativicutes]|uniref:TetR family transcriptional regulator n=1 Tax=Negativicutes TaxID=909932 RepID=UPI0025EB22E0|nr:MULTISPECIES: TetR family transcriptional regulator [Negativicutes]